MSKPRLLSFILAFLSGYVDTAVFVYMGGLFVAHVTGNFVLLGATLAGQHIGGDHGSTIALQLLAFPVFIAAAGFAAIVAGRVGAGTTRMLLAMSTLILAGVAIAALLGLDVRVPGSLALVVAMGILNAAHRLDPSLGPPFTVMTGNVTGIAIVLARLARLAPASVGGKQPIALAVFSVVGFLFGCAGGAIAQAYLGLGAMIVPALLTGAAIALVGPGIAAAKPAP